MNCRNWEKIRFSVEIATLIAVVIYACLTYCMLRTQQGANQINQESLTAVQRAFVTVTELTMEPTRDKNGNVVSWMFKPQVINSGSTPTKYMEYLPNMTYGPTKPTKGWSNPYPDVKFPEGPPDPDNSFNSLLHGHAVLGPHATMHLALGGAGIGVDIIKNNIEYGWRFYTYGVIHYDDILSHSKPHVTKYCYAIGVTLNDKSEIVPNNGLCKHWNCADDECRTDRKAWVAEITDAFARAGKKVPEKILSYP